MEKVIEPYRYKNDLYKPYIAAYECQRQGLQETRHCYFCSFHFTEKLLRIGVRTEHSIEPEWYHTECFWTCMNNGSNGISVNLVNGLDQLLPADQLQLLKSIADYQKTIEKDPTPIGRKMFKYSDNKEAILRDDDTTDKKMVLVLAKSLIHFSINQDTFCSTCFRTIFGNTVRLMTNGKWFHYECALNSSAVIIGTLEATPGYKMIGGEDRNYIRRVYCRNLRWIEEREKIGGGHLRLLGGNDKVLLVLSITVVWLWENNFHTKDTCEYCKKKFVEFDEPVSKNNGYWSHTECLFQNCSMIFETPDSILNWEHVPESVKEVVWKAYYKVIQTDVLAMTFPKPTVLARKRAAEREERITLRDSKEVEVITLGDDTDEESLWMDQLSLMNAVRERLKELDFHSLKLILEDNKRRLPPTLDETIEQLVDISVFGPPAPCPICKQTVIYVPSRCTYACFGFKSVFTGCNFASKNPPRELFTVPVFYQNVFSRLSPRFVKNKIRYYAGGNDARTDTVRLPKYHSNASKVFHHEVKYLLGISSEDNPYSIIQNGFSFAHRSPHNVMTENGVDYHAFMSLVDVDRDVNILFEIVILEDEQPGMYYVDQRLSQEGTKSLETRRRTFNTRSPAKSYFENQFYRATQHMWSGRQYYQKVSGYYFWNSLKYETLETVEHQAISETTRNFLNDILGSRGNGNQDAETRRAKTLRAKLSLRSRALAFNALESLQKKRANGTDREYDHVNTSNMFYSVLSAVGFATTTLGVIDDEDKIAEAFGLLENASSWDIHKKEVTPREFTIRSLGSQIKLVDRGTFEWSTIEEYLMSSRGMTHKCDVELMDIFKIDRIDDSPMELGKNTMLLWHGTKKEFVPNILKDGLKVPLGNTSRLMFGNGIYFADAFSKSIFYSQKLRTGGEIAYVLLCEVDLGNCYATPHPQSQFQVYQILKQGYNSIKGTGWWTKSIWNQIEWNQVAVPTGPLYQATNIRYHLNYNEYVVYRPQDVRVKFAVKVKIIQAAHII